MSNLTPKQEAFALAYVETSNASEAYRLCYAAEKMAVNSVNREAHALLNNPKVAARVATLRGNLAQKSMLTLEDHIEKLKELRDAALADGKYAAAVSAEMARGKVCGLYVEKVDHSSTDGTMSPKGRTLDDFYSAPDVSAKP